MAAGAIGLLGAALYQGSQESCEFQNTLTLSGNRAGISAEQMQTLASSIGESTESWVTAREAITKFARSGSIAREDYEQFATAVTEYSQASGREVADLVKEFSEIGKDPVAAIEKYSGSYRSLTADIYVQARAPVEQGEEAEAVRLVQGKLAEEMEYIGKKVNENLGYIEKGWNAVKNAIVGVWESAKSWARE